MGLFSSAYRLLFLIVVFAGVVLVMFLCHSYGPSLLACGFQKRYLLTGAAVAFCLGEIVLVSMTFACFVKSFLLALPGPDVLWRLLFANADMALAVYHRQAHLTLRLLFGVLIYVVGLQFSGILSAVTRKKDKV